jgi:hypothetical protein
MRANAESKLGFYPIANEALAYLTRALCVDGETAILDPCAGEGAAIKFIGEQLGIPQELTYAIELAENRAVRLAEALPNAKRLGPASFMATHISPNSFGLVWCNPPFQDEIGGGKRVEYSFLARATSALVKGGVMAFLMPKRAMGHEVERFFVQHYEEALKMPLPDQWRQYDEIMLVGKKRAEPVESWEDLPERSLEAPDRTWTILSAKSPRAFAKTGPTPQELERLLARSPLSRVFDPPKAKPIGRPPLPLGKGHLALLLASGQLNGLVPSDPPHVVRGTSIKEEYISEVKTDENEETGVTTTTIMKREKVILIVRTVDEAGVITTLEGA